MKKTINEIYLKIVDKFPIKEKHDFDEELVVFLKGEVVNKTIKNNQDGTCDLVLHFKAEDFSVSKKEDVDD